MFREGFVFTGRILGVGVGGERREGKERGVLKIRRASGGCLGAVCRRRTCQATIRGRERQARIDLPISEWVNPASVMGRHPCKWRGTRGTETSKYPQEKKADAMAQVAASERV